MKLYGETSKKISYCFETRENKLNYYLGSQYEIKENENEC